MAIRKLTGKVPSKPSYAYLIEKKREGHEFTEDEVRNICLLYTSDAADD